MKWKLICRSRKNTAVWEFDEVTTLLPMRKLVLLSTIFVQMLACVYTRPPSEKIKSTFAPSPCKKRLAFRSNLKLSNRRFPPKVDCRNRDCLATLDQNVRQNKGLVKERNSENQTTDSIKKMSGIQKQTTDVGNFLV